jgi:hypothetical protein
MVIFPAFRGKPSSSGRLEIFVPQGNNWGTSKAIPSSRSKEFLSFKQGDVGHSVPYIFRGLLFGFTPSHFPLSDFALNTGFPRVPDHTF